jgi:phenylalanine ammonia-lyase
VTTGFGGSADSRTLDFHGLQAALLQLTQTGVLTESDFSPEVANYDAGFHSMPVTWVRATVIVRCNHLLRGHSGVRYEIIENLLKLLDLGMTPIVPLRGSISASGDLMPLAYIAGILEGNPDIKVHWEKDRQGAPTVLSAPEALKIAKLNPITLGPKEGLGLLNGAAASAAVASLAVYDTNHLAILTQVIVGMSCEALLGNAENYHHFIAAIRPHRGQLEVARNIRNFVRGSSLLETSETKDRTRAGLFQDRYAIRGASQWLGPGLEDLLLSIEQLSVELNSTQDNPVIDTQSGEVYSGCNFQAASVTTATEKTRLALQMMGKMLFSVSSELINPDLNRGLPPNLTADDPNLSFTMKGVDINMAAYMSELAFLANPVSSHVQSAEMHNQPINSLALISSRYTMQAVETLSLMCAAHLYVVCQALDLRVLNVQFQDALEKELHDITRNVFDQLASEPLDSLLASLSKAARSSWSTSARENLQLRAQLLGNAVASPLMDVLQNHGVSSSQFLDRLSAIAEVKARVTAVCEKLYATMRIAALSMSQTEKYLGGASKILYQFVRHELQVPFHSGRAEHPTVKEGFKLNRERKTIGSWISIIYQAIRGGQITSTLAQLADCFHHCREAKVVE